MPKQEYKGEQAWAYDQGYQEGLKDNRTERGLMNFGGAFAGDRQTELNLEAWRDGFEDGQRYVGLDPALTYCSQQEYPGGQREALRREAERKRAEA